MGFLGSNIGKMKNAGEITLRISGLLFSSSQIKTKDILVGGKGKLFHGGGGGESA